MSTKDIASIINNWLYAVFRILLRSSFIGLSKEFSALNNALL